MKPLPKTKGTPRAWSRAWTAHIIVFISNLKLSFVESAAAGEWLKTPAQFGPKIATVF